MTSQNEVRRKIAGGPWQMYIITVKQAGHELQYAQGQFNIPMMSANAKVYWLQTCCYLIKTYKLKCWYPVWEPGVISVQPLPCHWHNVYLMAGAATHECSVLSRAPPTGVFGWVFCHLDAFGQCGAGSL